MGLSHINSPPFRASLALRNAYVALHAAGIACSLTDPPGELLVLLQDLILTVVVQDPSVFDRAHFDHLMSCWEALEAEQVTGEDNTH